MNTMTLSSREIQPRPYIQRNVHNLLYLKAALEQRGELVPTDLLAALSAKGVIV